MQGQFLVSIGSRDIHNHILDIKSKEKNLKNIHTDMMENIKIIIADLLDLVSKTVVSIY